MILKFCDSRSVYKFVASYVLCAVCIQTSLSIFVIRIDLAHMQRAKCFVLGVLLYRGTDMYLARQGRKQARNMSGMRAISTTSRRELSSSFFFLQGKEPKEIHAILTET